MSGAFETMKKALEKTGLYNVSDNNIYFELMAYACEIERLNNELSKMLCECFVDTASGYGLSERESVIGNVRSDIDVEKRREMLTLRERINSSCFTLEKIKEALTSFGLEFQLYEYPTLGTVVVDTIGTYTVKEKAWIRSQVKKIMPAHLYVQVVFDGITWSEIDRLDNTFEYMDLRDMTWNDIDDIE